MGASQYKGFAEFSLTVEGKKEELAKKNDTKKLLEAVMDDTKGAWNEYKYDQLNELIS